MRRLWEWANTHYCTTPLKQFLAWSVASLLVRAVL